MVSERDNTSLPKATHEGVLNINDIQIDVAVLDDGRRIVRQSGVFKAFGRPSRGNSRVIGIPTFMDAQNLQPLISDELRSVIMKIDFVSISGSRIQGYEASILPLVCELYLKAREEGVVKAQNQLETAQKAEIVLRSFAKLGITALVDEATGYQYVRERDELQRILNAFIAEELQPWQKTFPDSFYKQIFRLNGWDYTVKGIQKRPGVIGRWTNEYVYEQLPKGVLEELKRQTPKGKRYHQSLSPDVGHPTLTKQITRVVTLMGISSDMKDFENKYNEMVRNTPPDDEFAGKPVYHSRDKQAQSIRDNYDKLLFDDEGTDY